jgi:hypothetical protein
MQKVLYKKDKDTPFEIGYFVGFMGTGSDAQAVIAKTDGRPVMIHAKNFDYDLRFITPDFPNPPK